MEPRAVEGSPGESPAWRSEEADPAQNAEDLNDLRIPPGNKLEKLSGERAGQHAIRINVQYRVCFVWEDGDAFDVEIVDYHR